MKRLSIILVFVLVLASFTGPAAADREKGHERHEGYAGKFYGVVESMPEQGLDGIWIVNGREVLVTGQTEIEEEHGKVEAGAYVEVEGNYEGNTFTAYEIEVKGDKKSRHKKGAHRKAYNSKFYGMIESMPESGYNGVWIVDGRKVEVNKDTIIDETRGKAANGASVKIKGVRTGNTITAIEIDVKGESR